jgi:hypothetical protein
MMSDSTLDEARAVITAAFPDLSGAVFTLMTAGWHSTAVDVDDRLIFKFPRHAAAQAALVKEAGLLAVIRPAVTMPVPDLTLHDGPPVFSRHGKLRGDHLTSVHYDRLPEAARRQLADRLARFYAEIHGLDPRLLVAAGAAPVEAWLGPDEILRKALPALPPDLQAYARRTVAAWQDLPPDPFGQTYGFFDGHGWNMAFDHTRNQLTGIYDFADSGFGPLHQDFIYSNFIAPDLTERIIGGYEALTGRAIDRRRVDLLTGAHRLWELAELADDSAHAPAMIRSVADWAGR